MQRKALQSANYEKEKSYFQEVDSFELLEESPSPKNFGTWASGVQCDDVSIPYMSVELQKWLLSKKLNDGYGPSVSLSKILEPPALPGDSTCNHGLDSSSLKTPEKASHCIDSGLYASQKKFSLDLMDTDAAGGHLCSQKSNSEFQGSKDCENIEVAVGKLSLTSKPVPLDDHCWDPFLSLLALCGQSAPSKLLDVFSKFWFVLLITC